MAKGKYGKSAPNLGDLKAAKTRQRYVLGTKGVQKKAGRGR